MSEIHEKIENALAEDVGDGFITNWLLVSGFVDANGKTHWVYYTPGNQSVIESRGLAELMRDILKYEQWGEFQDD